MKLNLFLVLSALFAYSDCMNLSDFSQISILKILHNHSGITDPENYMTSVDELGRAFSHVDELGSIKLAESLVKTYRANELNGYEILSLVYDAVRAGNTNAYVYFSKKIDYGFVEVIHIAAANGHLDILDREIAKTICYARSESKAKTVPDAIRAGYIHILRYFIENDALDHHVVRDSLIAALETHKQEVIDYLLLEPIYIDVCGTSQRFTYEECTDTRYFRKHDPVLIKAAEVGNMSVIQYYFERNMYTTKTTLEEAKKAAEKNSHDEIATLIKMRL